jgi:hypothetical protein
MDIWKYKWPLWNATLKNHLASTAFKNQHDLAQLFYVFKETDPTNTSLPYVS